MKDRTIKVSGANYEQIRKLAEATDMGVKAVAEGLIDEGLASASKTGKVVKDNPEALAKIHKSIAEVGASQEHILDRLDELEDEVTGVEEDESEDEPSTFKVKAPSVRREEGDGYRYHCTDCGALLTGEPEGHREETCRECGATLDWAKYDTDREGEGGGIGAGGVVLIGFLALLALSAVNRARTSA